MSDDSIILPYDDDSFDPHAPQKPGQALLGDGFAYIGRALTVREFVLYVDAYAFGTVPPDFVCLHHTAIPTLEAWCAGEAGMNEAQIKERRLKRLAGLRDFYAGKGWSAGPHLFIDDRWIYLFSPMAQVGVHAKWGNSFRAEGRLHYSIGIEVIGDYARQTWPVPVAANVRGAVRALQHKLKTFSLQYLYPTAVSKPGMIGTGDHQRCAYPERLRWGGLSSHRDYNKPECPGAAITEAYYTGVLRDIPASHDRRYRVKRAATAGAIIRSAPRTNAAVLGRLKPGDSWVGEMIPGQLVTIAGFGSSNQWVRDSTMRCVWSGLLEEVR